MLDSFIAYIGHIQDCLNRLGSLGIFYYPLNFLVSATVSYLTYPVMIQINDKLLKQIIEISALHRSSGATKNTIVNKWFFKYAITTGFSASALIALQFKALSLETAIIYGLIGPYALTKRIVDAFGDKVEADIKQSIIKTVQAVELNYDKSKEEVIASLAAELKELSKHPKGGKDNAT